MGTWYTKSLFLVIFGVFLICDNVFAGSNYESIFLKEILPPGTKVIKIAEKVMSEYKNYANEAWGTEVMFYSDKKDSKIYTNWHKVHKGEIEWKIEVGISGDFYRIDVWERPSLSIFKTPQKGHMACLEEWRLQYLFEQLLISEIK